jgi:hypothetical protein
MLIFRAFFIRRSDFVNYFRNLKAYTLVFGRKKQDLIFKFYNLYNRRELK